MSITTPDDRISTYNPVVATTTFPALFPVFDNSDLSVLVNGVERSDFTVSATYVDSISNDAAVVFSPGITGDVKVVGSREPRRQNRFGPGPVSYRDINVALDTIQAEMQESHRDIDRAAKSPIGSVGQTIPDAENGKLLGWANGKLANLQVAPQGTLLVGATGALALASPTPEDLRTVAGVEYANDTEAAAGLVEDRVLSPSRGADQIKGYEFKSQATGKFGRSLPARFGDVIDLAEFIDPTSGTHAANAARVNSLLANASLVTDRVVVKFPKGINRLKKLVFPSNINFIRFVGEWPSSVLEFDETSSDWVQLGGNCDYLTMSGLVFQKKSGNVLTGGYAIALSNGAGWYEPLFEDLLIYQPYAGMQIGKVDTATPTDVCHLPTIRNVSVREAEDNSFVFGQCYDPRLTDLYSGKSFGASSIGSGFLFTDWCQAGYARQCVANGGAYGWQWGDGDGTDVSINAMDLSGCVGDNARLASFAALGVDRLKINGFGATQQAGAYVVRVGEFAREVCLDNFYGENGARDIVLIAPGARRTQIHGGQYVSGSLDAPNVYAGIRAQDNAQDFQIDGVRAFNKTGYYNGQQAHGVAIGPGCDNYTVVNCSLRGNQTAAINNGSPNAPSKVVANNLT